LDGAIGSSDHFLLPLTQVKKCMHMRKRILQVQKATSAMAWWMIVEIGITTTSIIPTMRLIMGHLTLHMFRSTLVDSHNTANIVHHVGRTVRSMLTVVMNAVSMVYRAMTLVHHTWSMLHRTITIDHAVTMVHHGVNMDLSA
jgi:hypothetical protein